MAKIYINKEAPAQSFKPNRAGVFSQIISAVNLNSIAK